jgi:HD-GYP domain-containing protein (c-di-GMP phosphodiesterase class II)
MNTDREWRNFMDTLAGQAAIAIDNAMLFKNLQWSNTELTLAYEKTIEGWSRALDLRDKETEDHTRRVTEMTVKLARQMGIPEPDLIHIQRGAVLHDIGKVSISDSILLKAGPLSEEEWRIMRRHPLIAMELLAPIAYLAPALAIPRSHHERWEGGGYPDGLTGDQIPLAARIFTIVDVYDALTSDRPYRRAWSQAETIEFIRAQAGKQFDPNIVPVFIDMITREYKSAG